MGFNTWHTTNVSPMVSPMAARSAGVGLFTKDFKTELR